MKKWWAKALLINIIVIFVCMMIYSIVITKTNSKGIGITPFAGFLISISMICGFISAVIIYFMPSCIASDKNHRNATAIGMLNLFLGWTFIGWVICLVWASTNDKKEETKVIVKEPENKYSNLEKLQKLKESGALTEEEFEIEKKKILK